MESQQRLGGARINREAASTSDVLRGSSFYTEHLHRSQCRMVFTDAPRLPSIGNSDKSEDEPPVKYEEFNSYQSSQLCSINPTLGSPVRPGSSM